MQVGSTFDVQRWTFEVRSLLAGAMPEGTMRTSNAQHRTPNPELREMERAMNADYVLEECAQHPNGRAKKAVGTQASRFDVRCSALDVRSSFPVPNISQAYGRWEAGGFPVFEVPAGG